MAALRASLSLGPRVLEYTNGKLSLSQADKAVELLLTCSGRRCFTGVGKSGLAAQRMASSLTSIGERQRLLSPLIYLFLTRPPHAEVSSLVTATGLASHFVHGAEWAHGEYGGVGHGDVVTAVSHSGTTAELLDLATRRRELGQHDVTLISLTGDAASPLALAADVSLTAAVPAGAEAVHDLLPTASVLAAHHVFNALLCECAARLELTPEDVRRHHPKGNVARRAADAADQ